MCTLQLRKCPCLTLEALDAFSRDRGLRMQHFDRNAGTVACVTREPHDAKSSRTQQRLENVGSDLRARDELHMLMLRVLLL